MHIVIIYVEVVNCPRYFGGFKKSCQLVIVQYLALSGVKKTSYRDTTTIRLFDV